MKLNEVYNRPLKEVLENMTMVDMKVHTDDCGEVRAVELKYASEPGPVSEAGDKKNVNIF